MVMSQQIKKKSRTPLVRTDKNFHNRIIRAIRIAFPRYSPKYKEVLEKNRVEQKKYNKNGTIAKRNAVFYVCDVCGSYNKSSEVAIDHIQPVVEIGKTSYDYTLDEYVARLDCDVDNLQVLCKKCHDDKTFQEKEQRKQINARRKVKNELHKYTTLSAAKAVIQRAGYDVEDFEWDKKNKQMKLKTKSEE